MAKPRRWRGASLNGLGLLDWGVSQSRAIKVYLTRPSAIVAYPTQARDIHRNLAHGSIAERPRSLIPLLAALPLHGDAGGIVDLDPDWARTGAIGAVNLLGHDALGTKPAGVREHGRAIPDDMLIQQDARLGIAK